MSLILWRCFLILSLVIKLRPGFWRILWNNQHVIGFDKVSTSSSVSLPNAASSPSPLAIVMIRFIALRHESMSYLEAWIAKRILIESTTSTSTTCQILYKYAIVLTLVFHILQSSLASSVSSTVSWFIWTYACYWIFFLPYNLCFTFFSDKKNPFLNEAFLMVFFIWTLKLKFSHWLCIFVYWLFLYHAVESIS